MASSRKDSRGYVLRPGECQRADGRYVFAYTDRLGNRHFIYGKTLVDLRQKGRKIARDIDDGIDPKTADRVTVNRLFDKYLAQKFNLKNTTKAGYVYTYDHFVRDTYFGNLLIAKVKYTDVKRFYNELLEDGLAAATVDNVHCLLHPAFQMAVRDDILRKNPTNDVMAEIKKSKMWVNKKRIALTIPQQKAFMGFLGKSNKYHGWEPVITVLIGTGMRIGECLGLTWDDLDFDNKTISVNHNLIYRPIGEDKKCVLTITTPKSEAGTRIIPMFDEVYDAFLEEYQIQKCIGFNHNVIDGYSGFVFTSGEGNVYLPEAVNEAIHRIADEYNVLEAELAEKEKREPILLPRFSAHSLRHTFCTRLCEKENNVKLIQSIMGHADIRTTMDIYADVTKEKKQEVFTELQNKIVIR